MAVRSTVFRCWTGNTTINAWVDQYVCPAGRTAIIRIIVFGNLCGYNANVTLAVHRGASYAQIRNNRALLYGDLLYGPDAVVLLAPGDALASYFTPASGSSGSSSCYAAGSLLNGVMA